MKGMKPGLPAGRELGRIQAVRTAVFYLLSSADGDSRDHRWDSLHCLAATDGGELGLATYWRNSNVVMLRWIVGIRTAVEGGESIPPGPCIIAAKHQSDWDIFAILPYTDSKPAYIAKRELIDFRSSWAAQVDRHHFDRSQARLAGAIRAMLRRPEEGCARLPHRHLSRGTRKAPLADPDYRQDRADVRTLGGRVPVALNPASIGAAQPRDGPVTARAKFLPAIMPGLPPSVFAARLKTVIETETTRSSPRRLAGDRPAPRREIPRSAGGATPSGRGCRRKRHTNVDGDRSSPYI